MMGWVKGHAWGLLNTRRPKHMYCRCIHFLTPYIGEGVFRQNTLADCKKVFHSEWKLETNLHGGGLYCWWRIPSWRPLTSDISWGSLATVVDHKINLVRLDRGDPRHNLQPSTPRHDWPTLYKKVKLDPSLSFTSGFRCRGPSYRHVEPPSTVSYLRGVCLWMALWLLGHQNVFKETRLGLSSCGTILATCTWLCSTWLI